MGSGIQLVWRLIVGILALSWAKKTPGAKGLLVVKLGLTFYDWFARANRTMPKHRIISRDASRRQMPMLSRAVRGVAEYYDARLVHPERLALELVKDAERDCPESVAVPYVALDGREGDRLVLRDEVSGERFTIQPAVVVNCAGAWVDTVNRGMGIDERLIGGTRGSHLVLRRPDLCKQLNGSMLYFETHDHRACLVYPLDDKLILLGTTDIRDENPDSADCASEEIDYLFGVLEEVLPGSRAKREEIAFVYAGVRPLPWSGASATGAISRDHAFKIFGPDGRTPFPVMALVGGKWTTYRSCAEDNCRVVLDYLGKPHLRSTLEIPVGGSAGLPKDSEGLQDFVAGVARASGVERSVAAQLVHRYGSQATEVAEAVAKAPRPLSGNPAYHEGKSAGSSGQSASRILQTSSCGALCCLSRTGFLPASWKISPPSPARNWTGVWNGRRERCWTPQPCCETVTASLNCSLEPTVGCRAVCNII